MRVCDANVYGWNGYDVNIHFYQHHKSIQSIVMDDVNVKDWLMGFLFLYIQTVCITAIASDCVIVQSEVGSAHFFSFSTQNDDLDLKPSGHWIYMSNR